MWNLAVTWLVRINAESSFHDSIINIGRHARGMCKYLTIFVIKIKSDIEKYEITWPEVKSLFLPANFKVNSVSPNLPEQIRIIWCVLDLHKNLWVYAGTSFTSNSRIENVRKSFFVITSCYVVAAPSNLSYLKFIKCLV